MKTFSIKAVRALAGKRRPGYVEAVFAASRREGDRLIMEDADYNRIAKAYAISAMDAHHARLVRHLSRLGIAPEDAWRFDSCGTPGCGCAV